MSTVSPHPTTIARRLEALALPALVSLTLGGAALSVWHLRASSVDVELGAAVLVFGLLSAISGGAAAAFAIEARRSVAVRRRVERELRASLRETADITFALDESAIVAVADAEGRVVSVNDKFCEISKYSREELTGEGRRIVEPSDRSEEFARVLWATISRGRVWRGEVREIAKDGSHYWAETTVVPFVGEGGKPTQYIAIRHDITKRKSAELALARRWRFATLNAEVGAALQPDAGLGDGLHACAEALTRGLDTAVARIWTVDVEVGALDLRASAGTHGEPGSARVDLDDATRRLGLVAHGGLPYVVDDLADDPLVDREWAACEGLVAFAACPLVVDRRTIGVVEIYDRRPLSDATLQAVSLIADRIAIGIEHKRVEAEIKRSLVEKEAMLKEIHHRVKNNLQIVSSLLSLQSAYVDDERALQVFAESQLRVQSMALVHEHLYRSDDLSKVNFADYVRELGASLVSSSIADLRTIDLEVEVDELYLGIHKAVPCGLIVNELVSNAIKHAFPDGRRGTVHVGFHCVDDRTYRLSVRDDGVGLPGGAMPKHSTSMGLRLVTILVDQIGGTLEVRSEGGAEFDVTFVSPAAGRQDAVHPRGEGAAPHLVRVSQ